jgi:hypothetical protein
MMWSVVGGALLVFGVRWVLEDPTPIDVVLIGVAVVVGWLKSRFVLVRVADRIVERIRARGDGRCIGGFLSLRTWGLVAVMVIAGRVARSGLFSHHAVGLVYILVGTSLVLASRVPWRAVRADESPASQGE